MYKPEEAKQIIAQFKTLPPSQKNIVIGLTRKACASCEADMEIPNTSLNHGICRRHAAAWYADLGIPLPANAGTSPDLSQVPRDLVDMAWKITALRKQKHGVLGKSA